MEVHFWGATFGGPLRGSILEEVHGRSPRKRSTKEVHGRGPRKRFMEGSTEEVRFLKSTLGDDFGGPLWGSILEVHIGGPLCSLHISVING